MTESSAGNTRGLIEASSSSTGSTLAIRLPRGIPAASLKREWLGVVMSELPQVFRGEYPRPH